MSSSSIWAAKFRLLLLTASRRAEEAREATFLALTTIWGEEVMEARASAFWRAAFLAAST